MTLVEINKSLELMAQHVIDNGGDHNAINSASHHVRAFCAATGWSRSLALCALRTAIREQQFADPVLGLKVMPRQRELE